MFAPIGSRSPLRRPTIGAPKDESEVTSAENQSTERISRVMLFLHVRCVCVGVFALLCVWRVAPQGLWPINLPHMGGQYHHCAGSLPAPGAGVDFHVYLTSPRCSSYHHIVYPHRWSCEITGVRLLVRLHGRAALCRVGSTIVKREDFYIFSRTANNEVLRQVINQAQ